MGSLERSNQGVLDREGTNSARENPSAERGAPLPGGKRDCHARFA
jgi:hypothetical protein